MTETQQNSSRSAIIPSPFGHIKLTEKNGALKECRLTNEALSNKNNTSSLSDCLQNSIEQLNEYFEGHRTEFTIPLAPEGTEFQQKVWKTLCTIPHGTTWSYKNLAEAINAPKSSRAVGSANGKNPLWIIVPCHRVINENGALGGYAGGLEIKKQLLKLEAQKETQQKTAA